MSVFTQTHLEALARGERVPDEVFRAIMSDRDAVRMLHRLRRVQQLFAGASTDGDEFAITTPAAEVGREDSIPDHPQRRLPGMLIFLKCVAQAVVENGLRGLASMVPGGEFAYNVATAALAKYREAGQAANIREDIQQLAQASFSQARQEAGQVAREVASGGANDAEIIDLELYLAQIPAAVRQSQKRPEDPTGTTVSATFALNSPDDVMKLLPPRAVRFRPGDPLPDKPGWKLIEPLGVGGFGEVWLARHAQFETLTGAVKFCHDLQARDRALLHETRVIDRVMREGKIPGIVPLLDAHLEGETPWLMFEYISGGDLADVICEWQNLPQSESVANATAALHQLAVAVGHFHRLDPPVVHRDLKPANILRERNTGSLRVTDFGIGAVMARAALTEQAQGTMTRQGRLQSSLRGSFTPLYASPQQQEGGDPDTRDDVYALGVIGYQMLTGVLNRGPGPGFAAALRRGGASEALIALLGRCFDEDADQRPKDAVELAQQLAPLSDPPPLHPPAVSLATGSAKEGREMTSSSQPVLEADYAMSLHSYEYALVDQDVASLEQSWNWVGWEKRLWPAKVVRPGLRFYTFDTRKGRRQLCALLEVTRGGSFTFRSMEEFVQHVKRLTGEEPNPNNSNEAREMWSKIEERLRERGERGCTGLCLRWKFVKAVSIPLPGKFPQIGWADLTKPNYDMKVKAVPDAGE